MALQLASSFNSLTWAQQQLNPGFSATFQGPETFSFSNSFTVDTYNVNSIYATTSTLAPSASITIDLQNVTDFFNNTMVLSRIYGGQIGVTGGDLLIKPGASNGQQWFFNSLSDGMIVKDGADFIYNTQEYFTVTASTRNITLTNQSATDALTYKLAILGGTGFATTPTPSPTGTPVPTPSPTLTPVMTPTPSAT
jgi:hypothetical protein